MRRQVGEDVEVRYRIASLVLAVAAFLLITGAVADAQEVGDLARRGQVVEAVVTREPSGRTLTIGVEFTTSSGRTVQARTSRFLTEDLERGDRLRLEHDPQRPDRVQEEGWGEDYTTAIAFAAAGLLATVLLAGCVLRRWPRRLERPLLG